MPGGLPAGVRVWLLSFVLAEQRLALLLPLLSAAERARCLRYRSGADRIRFAAARAVLRRRLGERLGLPAAEVGIVIGPYGKPMLRGGAVPHFNLSHGGAWGLLAMSEAGPVGADIEAVDGRLGRAALAGCLTPAERRYCGRRDAEALFRVWCGKEAVLKALGTGFAADPAAVAAVPAAGRRYAVALPPGLPATRAWQLPAPDGFAAALALSDAIPAVLGRQAEMAAEGG
ncbi:4'-phosphopantetheinyl transferase family protein [Pseudothauera rhizosphaerae]|uniref:4'-phosphopantetheinyl transferase superfamily protein n=1 Tax=Pseudothauera rhizosphaerae TaxID=2565932 RepID=A0A4S4A9S5_9RHOO|nr:4'-phosphopantetheinyl transferase superfamily protein [Pseudothauera rhizosphaerae]THF55627.1 4'-phosphopantetheinyl transferase superfamily protein [Pseudothauera rhizosphaerae]